MILLDLFFLPDGSIQPRYESFGAAYRIRQNDEKEILLSEESINFRRKSSFGGIYSFTIEESRGIAFSFTSCTNKDSSKEQRAGNVRMTIDKYSLRI
ncbi:MAG: hypothetical protein K9N09_06390 [Candidatus Cloacimonetes bacterium]|nr:hypothetical protein [Candidatus Cloacimonadota bacterium]MCF7813635.1 hypothetical protein [Candidatus Cloacimonadota bacterium]MCF7868314.1 hypothetical protein [Candidatus Cloacimonadota bacterium]MCF7883788.1 hypothetical protein [Candidatus Cloacimonadota bacterium]